MKQGGEAMAKKDYATAAALLKQAMDKDSSRLEVAYQYAEALRLTNNYEKAEHYYRYVFKKDKGKTFPENLFWLAMMQKSNGKYLEAKQNFKKANTRFRRDKKSWFYLKSERETASADFALDLLKQDSVGAFIRNLKEINSLQADFGAVQADSSTLWYSSVDSVSGLIRLKKSGAKNGLWESGAYADSSFNAGGFHNANITLSPDKNRIYFSRCDKNLICSIYMSERLQDKWATPVAVDALNTSGYTTTQPMISGYGNSGEIIFFASDRPGGRGKLDIWYSVVANEKYSQPRPAGDSINSLDDETTPFYDERDSTLYFSSSWHNGLGGFDIFRAKGAPGSFSFPENIKMPFNTSANDFYFTLNADKTSGYLTSNRKGSLSAEGETCCNDIYSFELPDPVTEADSLAADTLPSVARTLESLKKYLPLTLYFHNDEPGPRTTDTTTKKNYLDTYKDYIALKEIYKKEYSAGLPTGEAEDAETDIESFFEDYVTQGVKNLEEFTLLLREAMENGFEVNLAIKGYASTLAKSDYNINLTRRRIASLKNYLSEYENGFFVPYINGTAEDGSLAFTDIPYGEYRADTLVSDNLNDLRNSVYSRKAALERKIEVIDVSVTDSVRSSITAATAEHVPEASFPETSHDFGEVKYGELLHHTFNLVNTGKEPLQIFSFKPSCGCTVAEWPRELIAPGESAQIKVTFDTKGKLGSHENTVTLDTSAGVKVLSVSANVVLKK